MPNWQRQEVSLPPPHRAVFLGKGLVCFLPQSSCCCLLGTEGWLFPEQGRGLSQQAPLKPSPPTRAFVSPLPSPQEEEIPELEIDVDELLDMESDDTRAARVKVRGVAGSGGGKRGGHGVEGCRETVPIR